MITAILLFISTALGIVLYMMYSFRFFFFLFFLLFALIIARKVIRNGKKYGYKSVFRAFHKYPSDNEHIKLVEFILRKSKQFHRLLFFDEQTIIFISESGIYLIQIIDYIGKILGKEQDPVLLLKNETKKNIPNFFIELSLVEKKLKEKVPDLEIQKIVVKKGICIISFPYSKEYKVFSTHNLYYELQKLEKSKGYNQKEIEHFYSLFEHYLSNDVKFKEKPCETEGTKLQSK